MAKFLVTEEQDRRYGERVMGNSKEPIQNIFPEIPNEWREMFRYPMDSCCPYCWKKKFSLNP